jgi:hypothetical protein
MKSKILKRIETLDEVDYYFQNRGLTQVQKATFWKNVQASYTPKEILEMARLYVLGKISFD